MPNYIKNILSIHGNEERLDKLIQFVKTDQYIFDFDKIIPMPKELDIEETFPTPIDQIEIRKSNLEKYGAVSWYSWCLKNWGTKWNARIEEDNTWQRGENVIQIIFYTAWNPPNPIYEKLNKIFPDLQFYALYQDEFWNKDQYYIGYGFDEKSQGIVTIGENLELIECLPSK